MTEDTPVFMGLSEEKKNNIDYITHSELLRLYPRNKASPTSKGGQGDVYASGNYAVKMFKDDVELHTLSVELNIYSLVEHPCIIKPICWSVDKVNGISYLVTPLGENIKTAYNKKISLKEIKSDLLSAIAFLNSIGIAHCDIKPDNIIFHDGKAKLIDMGIAKRAYLQQDGKYYITEGAYTPPYMDIEYSSTQQNNINCEVYAIIVSIVEIWSGKEPFFGSIYASIKDIPESEFKDFVKIGTSYADTRPNAIELLKQSPLVVRRYTGSHHDIPLDESCVKIPESSINKIINCCYSYNFSCETLFLALRLLQRSHTLMEENKLDLYLTVITDLANSITGVENFNGSCYKKGIIWANEMSNDDFLILFREMKIKILIHLKGIILTKTYWDHAQSSEDLISLLQLALSSDDIDNFQSVTGNNKCILLRELLTRQQVADLSSLERSPKKLKLEQPPSNLDTSPDINLVTEFFTDEWKKKRETETIPILIYNRSVLNKLNIDIALDIFKTLSGGANSPYLKDLVLSKICNYNWKEHSSKIIEQRLHPFDINRSSC
jgi:serine/threonine protein kinase